MASAPNWFAPRRSAPKDLPSRSLQPALPSRTPPCACLLRCLAQLSLGTRLPCIAAGRKSLTPLPGLLVRLWSRRLATCDLQVPSRSCDPDCRVTGRKTSISAFHSSVKEFDASKFGPREVSCNPVALARFLRSLRNDTHRSRTTQGKYRTNFRRPSGGFLAGTAR
jgi:hypothetical protein